MPAFHGAQVVDEFRLQVDAEALPDQADGAAGEGDVVARLDAIQVLEEEATAGEAILLIVLRFEQLQRVLGDLCISWRISHFSMPRPEPLWRLPAISQAVVVIAS